MKLLLAADIGGTKSILRLVKQSPEQPLITVYEQSYSSRQYMDIVPMVSEFLCAATIKLGYEVQPQKACFALAGPVVNNSSILTNLGWSLDAQRLEQELHINHVSLINDFVAVGYGVSELEPGVDLYTLQTGKPDKNAPIGVIGAGTGLGEGFVIPTAQGMQVYGTEGGHADFAPRSPLECQLLQYLLDKHNIERISVERVVSGQGIVSIYQYLRDRHWCHESVEIAEIIRKWEAEAGMERTVEPAAVIANAALEKSDRLSEQTLEIFIDLYGAEAGNLALKLLPYGGVYVAGGIAPKILSLIQEGTFIRAFTHKGRVGKLLEKIPVHIVLNQQVGLIGAAICADKLPD
jgi:glucokinase